MSMLALPSPPSRAAGRRMLALIVGLLALPFVLATLLWWSGWTPDRQINHGELLTGSGRPAPQLREDHLFHWESPRSSHGDSLRSSHGDSLRSQKIPGNATFAPVAADDTVLGHWTLALALPAECDTRCLAQLQLARQVQVSLNKEMARLKRALIGPQLHDDAAIAAVLARWPDLKVARIAAAGWPTLAGPHTAADAAPRLVLIDPRGRLVLRYTATPDPRGVRRDVERLLKFSWLG